MFYDPTKYSKPQEEKIEEIASVFGKPKDDDDKPKEGGAIKYKGKTYKVKATGIKLPINKEELKDIDKHLNANNIENTDISHFEHDEGPPYEDCFTYLIDLLDETKSKLRDFINELEDDGGTNRLEKPSYLGFYRPYHYWPQSWGIYLNARLLSERGQALYNLNQRRGIVLGLTLTEAKHLAFYKTYFHEVYHHKFELFATKIELAMRKPAYTEGFHKFYCQTFGTDYCLEEAFANVYGMKHAIDFVKENGLMTHSKQRLKKLLREGLLFNSQPGYRVSYEITGLNDDQAEKYFECKFMEILLDFTHRKLFNNIPPTAVDSFAWEMFTYRLDPLINKDNSVTFYIP
jgi:hypothetical protein